LWQRKEEERPRIIRRKQTKETGETSIKTGEKRERAANKKKDRKVKTATQLQNFFKKHTTINKKERLKKQNV